MAGANFFGGSDAKTQQADILHTSSWLSKRTQATGLHTIKNSSNAAPERSVFLVRGRSVEIAYARLPFCADKQQIPKQGDKRSVTGV